MLLKLKHKLTRICMLSTTIIITVITLIALNFSEKQLRTHNHFLLQNNLLTIIEHFQNQVFSYSWLAQMENNNTMVIDISTNSTSLSFPGSYITGSTRDDLISLSESTAKTDYKFSISNAYNEFSNTTPIIFSLYHHGRHYLSLITAFHYNDTVYQILLIQDMWYNDQQILWMRLFFGSLIVIGSLLLGLFSFWFVGNAIKPIEVSQKEQTDFVAAASHELRSPLSVIRTSADELIEDKLIPDKHFIYIISRECNQLTRLVNDLLFLARTDSGYWHIAFAPVELDTLLLDLYDSFFSLAEAHNHFLDLALPDTKQHPISVDSERLTQAISILIHNALTYTPASTGILLSLENLKGYEKISVIDHGPGIPAEAKPNIFKRFYRADSSRHASDHYGLGLSVASEIINLHHGSLSIEDTPDGGATFVILLPSKKD